jgi:DNA-binding beta-propeller fold protein YncE
MKNIFSGSRFLFLTLLCCFAGASCRKSQSPEPSLPVGQLSLVADILLPFPEPSGIAFSEELRKLWVVGGGKDQHVYRLDTNGNVEGSLFFKGTDLEGIAFDELDSTLWVIDEDTKIISHIDLDGNLLSQKQLTYSAGVNKGPEGIAVGLGHIFYVLNQRDPSVLFELDSAFGIAHQYPLEFAPDYSDITYDRSSDSFFILSGASAEFFAWTKQQGAIVKYTLPDIANEGIAYDQKRGVFYIVNDATGHLKIYRAQ